VRGKKQAGYVYLRGVHELLATRLINLQAVTNPLD